MKIIVDNVECKVVYGGADHLVGLDIVKVLREYLRARPKNYSRSLAYRNHRWDGWRYFITKDLRFATGFLPLVSSILIKTSSPWPEAHPAAKLMVTGASALE